MEKSFLINRVCTRIHFHFPFHFVCQCEAVPCPSTPSRCPFNGLAPIWGLPSQSPSLCFHTDSPILPPAFVCRMQATALFKVLSSERYKDRRLAHFQVTTDGLNSHSLSGITGVNHPCVPCLHTARSTPTLEEQRRYDRLTPTAPHARI